VKRVANNPIEDKLLQTVNSFQPQMVECCRRLIQIPSVNGVHDEIDVAAAIADQARDLGLHVQLVGEYPRRPNVIVSTAEQGETGLLLLGHLDTVPAGDEQRWRYPPFSGIVADGRIYGRGAIDTKGGMTAAIFALAALARTDGAIVAGRVQLVCFPDEESGATGNLGIKYLHARGLLGGLGAIYAYSGDQIVLGHRGLIRYRLVCDGQAIHTGAAEWQDRTAGANAVTGMARLLLALEEVETPYSTARYFERFRTVITPGTRIDGGISVNVVPDHCEALVDIRLTPEYNLERIESLMNNCIRQVERDRLVFTHELLNYAPAAISDENAPIFSILERAVQRVKGRVPERVVAGPANEGYLLIERGIPTVCGFGVTGKNAHAVDEYVEIQSLVDTAAIFALVGWEMSRRQLSKD
jgi:succinyl-diaminopimelate desuccinylase